MLSLIIDKFADDVPVLIDQKVLVTVDSWIRYYFEVGYVLFDAAKDSYIAAPSSLLYENYRPLFCQRFSSKNNKYIAYSI